MNILVLLLLILLPGSLWAEDSSPQRALQRVTMDGRDLEIGTYHLLGIAIDNYRDTNLNLRTAKAGAQALESVLTRDYTFEKRNISLLLDSEATRDGIIQALRDLATQAKENDSVLIYYAGHGHLDDLTKTGSWIPWGATFKTPAKWIGNGEIKRLINAMKARHVLLVSDSCFAGDFFRSQRLMLPQITDRNVRSSFSKISRWAMTAGGVEPVSDGGRDGQSVYTWWLLQTLRDTTAPYVLPDQIHDRVKKAVPNNSSQNPLLGRLHGAGGEPDGSFVFFRRGTASLDAALVERQRQIQELEKLDREASEELRRRQTEIVTKQQQKEALDARLAELQTKTGITKDENNLDTLLEILKEKEKNSRELEAHRKKVEVEIRAKELELEKARQKQEEERRQRFEMDYEKYKQIEISSFATGEFKAEAWRILCDTWNIPKEIPVGSTLEYRNSSVGILSPGTDSNIAVTYFIPDRSDIQINLMRIKSKAPISARAHMIYDKLMARGYNVSFKATEAPLPHVFQIYYMVSASKAVIEELKKEISDHYQIDEYKIRIYRKISGDPSVFEVFTPLSADVWK